MSKCLRFCSTAKLPRGYDPGASIGLHLKGHALTRRMLFKWRVERLWNTWIDSVIGVCTTYVLYSYIEKFNHAYVYYWKKVMQISDLINLATSVTRRSTLSKTRPLKESSLENRKKNHILIHAITTNVKHYHSTFAIKTSLK